MKKMSLGALAVICILTACERNENKRNDVPPNRDAAIADASMANKNPNSPDGQLAKVIRNTLQNDPQLSRANMSIKVEVNNGEVILSGFIDNEQNLTQVINLVQRINGVHSISNRLDIRRDGYANYHPRNGTVNPNMPSGAPEDRELEQRIISTLRANSTLAQPAQNVEVNVQNGVATLRGWTNNEYDRANIANRVRQLSGVNNIDNQIQVRR